MIEKRRLAACVGTPRWAQEYGKQHPKMVVWHSYGERLSAIKNYKEELRDKNSGLFSAKVNPHCCLSSKYGIGDRNARKSHSAIFRTKKRHA